MTAPSIAAGLKVLAGGSLTGPLNALAPLFERASGHKLTIHFDSTPNLLKQAMSEPFDVAVVPVDVFKNADARAAFAAGPTVDIARVGYSIAVKSGAPKPDIGTQGAFKEALLKAPSIAFLPESAVGAYILKVFERLGNAEAMKAKTKVAATPSAIAPMVAKGEAELGIFLTNVLTAPGVDIAGPFPGELQQDLVFAAGIARSSASAAAAKALIDYLRSPEARAVFAAKGMTAG